LSFPLESEFIKKDKHSLGALVTSHKIDAAMEYFDEIGDYVKLYKIKKI